ncbi:MAG: DUF502 domain-containing protein [Candidatus Omnitrophica bacterium]|jgi:uncharacterized membrane protein|nr:DUF502 domain-containing protein [Candidatus Omnitrophota bacterium]
MDKIKKYFITGIVLIIPVYLSIYLLASIFIFLDNLLGRFINVYLQSILGFSVFGLGFLVFLILIVLIGWLAKRFIAHRLFVEFEKWFAGLPLIRNIYPAIKEVLLFITTQKELGFKKVVLIEYPSKGLYSIGFLTNDQFEIVNKAAGGDMVSVFISTTPGPLTGNMVFVPRSQVKFLDVTVKQAVHMVMSGGVFKGDQ